MQHNHSITTIEHHWDIHSGIHKPESNWQMCHTSQFCTHKLSVQKHFQSEVLHKIFKDKIPSRLGNKYLQWKKPLFQLAQERSY